MKYTFTLFLLLFALFAFSQDYYPLRLSGVTHFQQETTGIVSTFLADSIEVDGSTTIVMNHPMIRLYPGTNRYNINGDSWTGRKTIIEDDGKTIFINKDYDSIYIYTQAALLDSWTLYTNNDDGSYFIATVSSTEEMEILPGITDMVKTVTLQRYNSSDYPTSSQFNDNYLLLSENYGIVRIFHFYEFPHNSSPDYAYGSFQQLDLIGITEPNIGWQNFGTEDIYVFELGDEIHLSEFHSNGYDDTSWLKEYILEVIEKTVSENNDTIIVDYERCFRRSNNGVFSYALHDTISMTHIVSELSPNISKYSFEPFLDTKYMFHLKTQNRVSYNPTYTYYMLNDSLVSDGGGADFEAGTYGVGLGHIGWSFWDAGITSGKTLEYYKKGDIEWGTPFNCEVLINSIEDVENLVESQIYPNPANSHISIVSNEDILEYAIYNCLGEIVCKQKFTNSSIDISNLKSGIFLVQVKTENGNSIMKFIKN